MKTLADINFKDKNFKKILSKLKIDSLSEIIEIKCHNTNITSINEIKYFPNLETLIIESYDLEELDLTNNEKLKHITIEDSEHIKEINFSKNTQLEILKLRNLDLDNLNLSNNIQLKELYLDGLIEMEDIDLTANINLIELHIEHMLYFAANLNEKNNQLKKIYCSYGGTCDWTEKGLPELEELTIENAEIDTLDVTALLKLKKLDITWNEIATIDLSKNILLEELCVVDNAFSKINLKKNKNLKHLYLGGDSDRWSYEKINYEDIDLAHNIELITLSINSSGFSKIDLSKNTLLEKLYIDDNPIKSIDLSKNTFLKNLNIQNTKLETIDLTENKKIEDLTLKLNKLNSIKFSDEMIIKNSNLSKDMLEDKVIKSLISSGCIFEND
jgi:hypothetical protein